MVQCSIWVSQSFLRKDLGWWVGLKKLYKRIVKFKNPVYVKIIMLFMKRNTQSIVLQMK